MSKVRTTLDGGQIFFCPGCKDMHAVNGARGPRWFYNSNPDAPTFSPSILVTCDWQSAEAEWQKEVCHSFVRDGRIQFLNDCTHALAGQTVEIPEWPYAAGAFGGIVEAAA